MITQIFYDELVSDMANQEEENDGDTIMEDVEFPKIRRFNEVEGTDRDLRGLFANYDTNVPIDFQNLERELNQNHGKHFKQKTSNCLVWSIQWILKKLSGTTEPTITKKALYSPKQ